MAGVGVDLHDGSKNEPRLIVVDVVTGLAGDDEAIGVEPAKSGDLAPIIIEAYGLTPRERDVVRAIARGSSTPDIATELFLSAHTVRDYI